MIDVPICGEIVSPVGRSKTSGSVLEGQAILLASFKPLWVSSHAKADTYRPMLSSVAKKLRMFLRSELDLSKDRMLAELRQDIVPNDSRIVALQNLGWYFEGDRPFERIVGFGIHFDPVLHAHWIESMPAIALLIRDCGATLHLMPDRQIEIRIGSVRVVPETCQEFAFLIEVFHQECYCFESLSPMFVWDIGANVGIASMYFADVHGWDVAAYELCPPTADAARRNIHLSELDSKVQVHSCGIGGKSETMKISYSGATRGSNGILGNTTWESIGAVQDLEVQVRDSSEVFDEILRQSNGRPILAKIDCEGAEYALLERLHETGKLQSISAVILEAHVHPGLEPGHAVTTLLKGGFAVRRMRRLTERFQVIYATRLN